jgi:dethiobiotin synthetase
MNYFVTAIGTDSGKTLISAILCEALGADYWKPVQCGEPRDTDTVQSLVTNKRSGFHRETYLLKMPASPHAAAHAEGIKISLNDFKIPRTKNDLIIEGAGGCLVPLNDGDFMIDLASALNTTIILVADLYLGSINHTLLTLEAIRKRYFHVRGIIFNGPSNPESESIILKHAAVPCLLKVDQEKEINAGVIQKYAHKLKETWHG